MASWPHVRRLCIDADVQTELLESFSAGFVGIGFLLRNSISASLGLQEFHLVFSGKKVKVYPRTPVDKWSRNGR